jgi:drug/metabolite transporter (DMT)-like permease
MSDTSLKPYAWMLAGNVWFAAMVLFINATHGTCQWQSVAVVRSGLASVLALAILVASRTALPWPGPRILWVRSIAGSLSMVCTFYALGHLPGSDVLVITNTYPLFVALLSWPTAGQKPTASVWVAVLCAITGMALIRKAEFSTLELAHASAMVASFFTAVAMMGLNRLQGVASVGIVAHFSVVSLLFCVASFWIFPQEPFPIIPESTGAIVKLILVGVTATIGQLCLTKAFRSGVATKVAVLGLSQVVIVIAWEALIDGRKFDLWMLLGTTLVLGPVAYLMLTARRVSLRQKLLTPTPAELPLAVVPPGLK